MRTIRILTVFVVLICAGAAVAGFSYISDFESPDYSLGALNGQGGWTVYGPDQTVPSATVGNTPLSNGFAGNGSQWVIAESPVGQSSTKIERTIAPDENLFTASWLWMPDDRNSGESMSSHFQLRDDAGEYYFYAWYRNDEPLYIVTDATSVWTDTGFDPGEQAFVMEVEIDFALHRQKFSITPVATGMKMTTPWYNLDFGRTPSLADANGGTFWMQTAYGAIDDVSLTPTPEDDGEANRPCGQNGPKNVILFIGDGMGPEQVKAAGMYANGEPNTLCFESFPHKAWATTYSANASVTDSAAAATAIATGYKVNNGVISLAFPGDGSELETLLEYLQTKGKSIGLVTTTYIAHATPAGFGAHESSRNNYSAIIGDYLNQTKPNVLFGGAVYISPAAANDVGYTVVTDRASMGSLDTNSVEYASGQFHPAYLPYEYDEYISYPNVPHLSEMTATALDILDNEPNGFFLMVEGGRIDHAGHINHIQRNVFETIEFANAVQQAIN